ncbi:MAG TPA: amino acid permease [Terriglobales bacterium]|nr:amino acid permease [Terriglobales bacterium]
MPEPAFGTGRPELARELTLSHATAIVIGTVIGSGIFLVPAEMMQAVGSSGLVYLAWIVGGLLSLAGAITYAELGAMKPFAGGEYVYVRDGWGGLAGFLYAWTYFIVAKPGSMATIATGFVRILSNLGPLQALGITQADGWHPTHAGQALAIAAVALITFINYIGVRRAGEFQLFFTVLKVAIIAVVIACGFLYARGGAANFATTFIGARGGFAGFMAALVAALWAYDGWNLVTTVSAEVREPQRNLPIALIFGMAAVGLLYMGVNAAVQYVMPASSIAASTGPALEAVRWVGNAFLGTIIAGMALAMLATLNGSTMTGARVPFAAARDGYFPTRLAAVHPRFRTPSASLIVQGVLAVAVLLPRATFGQLFDLTLFAEWIFYFLGATSIFIFRARDPRAPRPYHAIGYPVLPAVFSACALTLVFYEFQQNLWVKVFPQWSAPVPWNSISVVGALTILAGVPIFYSYSRRQHRRA